MSTPAATSLADLQSESLKSIANVSTLLRKAIASALPVAPEQYLTIAIPGTVVDLTDVDKGGSYVYNVEKHAFPPTAVRVSEAQLVDGMMPLSNIMIGNTGKSVTRSYSRALDGLIPKKAEIADGGIRSPGNKAYNTSMQYLTTRDPATGLTPVDVYNTKLRAWGDAQTAWQTAKIEAKKAAELAYPASSGDDFISKQQQYFADWNQENYYRYKSAAQGAYMDWVTNGNKYNVEYNFGMVDIDSIMQRIESSKESLRNSMIVDGNGANEVAGVTLTPRQWATYCKHKAENWYKRNGNYTVSQLDAEIERLQNLKLSYEVVKSLSTAQPTPQYPATGVTQPDKSLKDGEGEVKTALEAVYKARAAVTGILTKPDHAGLEAAQKSVADSETKLSEAQDTYKKLQESWGKYNMATLLAPGNEALQGWITSSETSIDDQIVKLQAAKATKLQHEPVTVPIITGATAPKDAQDKESTTGSTLAQIGSELAKPQFEISAPGSAPPATSGGAGTTTNSADDADPWTSISFSYSASDQKKSESQSSWGMSVGGSVGFGLWSVGGNYSHDESKSDMQSDMAACDVSISFSALVVNIDRPWLYGELFTDFDLEVAAGVELSPGPMKLRQIIEGQNAGEMNRYTSFPAYPTSFIVAADTTIELTIEQFNGSTQHIEQHFSSHSNAGSASVGYGPWSVSSNFHESASKQSMQVHTTATGCKLSFGAPQVIGWVSQILPALPRDKNFDPLTQGAGVPVSA
ncbi:hypothetical protein BX600DRAFT_532153 [Xylariales sp. PMI_506]|nr:hypothetical protein BX600DRAFT_532153 [Xylariales sp. PMI_506]